MHGFGASRPGAGRGVRGHRCGSLRHRRWFVGWPLVGWLLVGAGEISCGVAGGAGAAVQPAGESVGVAGGQLLEQGGAGLHDVQPLGGGQGVLEDGETGAPPPAQLGIGEHLAVHRHRGSGGWERGHGGAGACRGYVGEQRPQHRRCADCEQPEGEQRGSPKHGNQTERGDDAEGGEASTFDEVARRWYVVVVVVVVVGVVGVGVGVDRGGDGGTGDRDQYPYLNLPPNRGGMDYEE